MKLRPVMKLAAGLIAAALVISPLPASATMIQIPKNNALDFLALLPVSDTLPSKTYVRSYFKHWVDADKNGCDTRAEVLITESTTAVVKKAKTRCTVVSGTWVSAYDGLTLTTASKVDIDHMVPLAEAWRSGAYKWTVAQRQSYANDLTYARSLIAVSASSNRSKGDKDPALWLPTVSSYTCTYLTNWVAVKYRWMLSVDSQEKATIAAALQSCPAEEIALSEPPQAIPPHIVRA